MKRCILFTLLLLTVLCWLRRTEDAGDRALVTARKAEDDGTRWTADDIEGELFK